MKKIDLGQTIGILANVGVIGGLIFVGFQLRQDREIATIDSIQSSMSMSMRVSSSQLLAENSDVWVRGLASDSLSAEESAVFDAIAEARDAFYFGNYTRNVRIGDADDRDRWVREAALDIVSSPGLMKWWESQVKRRAVTDLNGSVWQAAVNREIDRLRSLGD